MFAVQRMYGCFAHEWITPTWEQFLFSSNDPIPGGSYYLKPRNLTCNLFIFMIDTFWNEYPFQELFIWPVSDTNHFFQIVYVIY